MWVATKMSYLIGSVVLTFIGYKRKGTRAIFLRPTLLYLDICLTVWGGGQYSCMFNNVHACCQLQGLKPFRTCFFSYRANIPQFKRATLKSKGYTSLKLRYVKMLKIGDLIHEDFYMAISLSLWTTNKWWIRN